MGLNYVKAKKEDADLLIELYNASFYADYMRYGECPAYGRSRNSMEESIEKFPKHIIYCEDKPIGAFSIVAQGNGEKKCGFRIDSTEMDGNVRVVHFVLDR